MELDDDWWERLITAWNSSPYVRELAGLGCVEFNVIGAKKRPYILLGMKVGMRSSLSHLRGVRQS